MTVANWDIKTADNCKLPDLIPDICNKCRDYRYCNRDKLKSGTQLDIFTLLSESQEVKK